MYKVLYDVHDYIVSKSVSKPKPDVHSTPLLASAGPPPHIVEAIWPFVRKFCGKTEVNFIFLQNVDAQSLEGSHAAGFPAAHLSGPQKNFHPPHLPGHPGGGVLDSQWGGEHFSTFTSGSRDGEGDA